MYEEQISGRNRTNYRVGKPVSDSEHLWCDGLRYTLPLIRKHGVCSYEWECQKLKEFCNNFDVYLYEMPREKFFKWEGIQLAEEGGYKGVILSDLS